LREISYKRAEINVNEMKLHTTFQTFLMPEYTLMMEMFVGS